MQISAKKVGKVITARNYVGVITMLDGTVIEILPKIFSLEDKPNMIWNKSQSKYSLRC
jgi:5-methylcytosine-specific restriction enzyme subunit McrC